MTPLVLAGALVLTGATAAATVHPHEGPYQGLAQNRRLVEFGYTDGRLADFAYGGKQLFHRTALRRAAFSVSGANGIRVAGRWTTATRVVGSVSSAGVRVPFAATWAAP